jgi:hypothetical protein
MGRDFKFDLKETGCEMCFVYWGLALWPWEEAYGFDKEGGE